MSQDTSNLQVIEKFSFIYTLTRSSDKNTKKFAKKVSVDIEELTDNHHREPCHEIVHASSSDSVTLSSILGFPNIVATNGAGLGTLDEPIADYSLDLSEQLEASAEENQSSGFIFRHLGKVVFVLSSSYLIFVTWWLTGHSYYGKIFPFSALRPLLNISGQQVSAADLQFIDYMERSLANIERQQTKGLSTSATEQKNSGVVYVPVYNLNNVTPTSEIHNSYRKFPLNSSVNNSPLPIPVIPPPPPIKLPRSNFSPSSMSMGKSTSSKLPSASPSSPVGTNNSSDSVASPMKNYTLIGIFELGKRSAALFKVDGVTKRIWVGEKLDNKGWILESVANQKAKISRQGEMRSLSVGEKF